MEVNINMKKNNNGEFRIENVGEEVELYGWVQRKRNLGGLLFIDLRDRSGIIQLVSRPEDSFYDVATSLKNESVIKAVGTIAERESKNTKLPTGEIEVILSDLELINQSEDIPFEINEDTTALEDTRLKYRYLDIRRENIKNNLILRNKVTLIARNFLAEKGFVEVETPILCVPTPEGARDYLVPSRINHGHFYALPQSPQIYKQLLMIGGMEKYFQIARCFRDEDLRADRQPEFTQIDIEMSFGEENDIWSTVEGLMQKIFKDIKDVNLPEQFLRLTYNECMDKYGSDKPDTRFEMLINDITEVFNDTGFEVFKNIISEGGIVNAIVLKNLANTISRKKIDEYTDFVKVYKAKALSYLKYNDKELSGSIVKVLNDKEKEELIDRLNLEENDMVFILADKKPIVKTGLGALRVKLAHEYNLIPDGMYNFLWVTEFPMYEFSEEENRYVAAHHPFTSPRKEDMDKLLTDKENCYSRAYDLVLNGYELLSGSVRIYDSETQSKVFEAIGMTKEEAEAKFGFFLEAFKYGAPPHLGVGIGLERLVMILCDTDNIRDVVAFPKTASASCLMSSAPGVVDKRQLDDLGIALKK
jgi:aspartyl-tRNA synthetase